MAPIRRTGRLLFSALFTAACTTGVPSAQQPSWRTGGAGGPEPAQKFVDSAPVASFADPARRAKLEAAFPAIDKAIETEMRAQDLPGLAVAIVIDGQIAYAKGFGVRDLATKASATADTVYRIGSISKSFTGLALLSLRDEGVLTVDDPLTRWIAEAAGLVYPTHDARPITLRQMLNHSSGLPRMGTYPPETAPSEDVMLKSLDGLPLDRAPGVASVYSNLGFSLLGIVVAHAAKQPLHDVIASRIWKPLGMTSTYWEAEQVPAGRRATTYQPSPTGPEPKKDDARLGAGDGAGGIYSTVEDMARYVAFQLDAYPPRNDRDDAPIRRASRREAHATGIPSHTQVAMALGAQPGDPVVQVAAGSYGFGWGREESCMFDELIGHGGAIDSHRADISFLPSRGVGVVVLSNFGNANTAGFSRLVLYELRRTGALEPRVTPIDPAFEPAVQKFLAAYNNWSVEAMVAMLDPNRPPLPEEKDEMAGYKALHGTCTAFHAVDAKSPTQATIGLTCERGTFEVDVTLDSTSRKIVGFLGTSRGVSAPPALAEAAAAITSLSKGWDETIYKRYLATAQPPHDIMKGAIEPLAAAHGVCTVKTPRHVGFDWAFELDCERGGGLVLTLVTDPKDYSVKGLHVGPNQVGMCPVR
jgi:CubicO group peptidase (beta-lactamase class C family)